MLGKLSEWVTRWDAATRTPRWRVSGALLGLVLGGALLTLSPPMGMSAPAWRTAVVAMVMASWWVAQVFPMAVTGLLPLLAFPWLGLSTLKDVAPSYAHPLLFLMLGGFLVAAGMERVGLHRRLVAWLLASASVRSSPRRIVLALMIATAVLSGLVSNTATTVMLLPVALALADRTTEEPRQRTAFVLSLAYAASIGGVTTLVGTPPNAVLAGLAADQGLDIGFARWMALGVPFAAVSLPIAWWVVTGWIIPLPRRSQQVDRPEIPQWTVPEVAVTAIVACMLVGWFTRAPLDVGFGPWLGWGKALGWSGSEADAWVAMAGGCAVFTVPRRDDEGIWRLLVDWKTAERAVPWSVILLLGGGFALAGQIKASGLTAWVASGAGALEGLPVVVTVFGVCIGMTFLTELTSNTASTQIVLPLLAAAAPAAGVDPVVWMVPATLAASCAFMMPVATAPNAIATEAGDVSPADMALCGLVLNPLLAIVGTGVSMVMVPLLFG